MRLDEAIELLRLAVAATAGDHPDRAQRLASLGGRLAERSAHAVDPATTSEAAAVLVEAADLTPAPARVRIGAARAAAELLAGSDPGAAADLLETAVRLLPAARLASA